MEQSSHVRATRRVPTRRGPATPDIFDEEYDDIWPSSRLSSSVVRYRSDVQTETDRPRGDEQWSAYTEPGLSRLTGKHAVPQRRTASQPSLPPVNRYPVDTEEVVPYRRPSRATSGYARVHWTVYVGLAMISMLLGWMLVSGITHWWQVTQDDLHYGRPRTFQMDYTVGHNDSIANPSHFIALNLNRHIQVIELQGGDAAKSRVYLGPDLVGADQDLAPVTLMFKDVNHDGKVDMLVNVQDSHFVFINDAGQFRSPRAGEHIQF
ncbi:hypothetical protein KDW_12210 [Dictyobacter vulcani]|uniref:VCBS repeat-containing protein n=1 Tax=Dictyobacter vulcani TaxID=2607529 RepID=A0A5J4KLL9_9CHLR|nr:hypothetical protein [Dictyobacter vulcani]GER87059.1 hypothetical protein KDW_12210 [Dictyobacter vulcani]